MPTKLNLASKPFSNRSLPWVVTTMLVVVSLVCLVFIVRATSRANAQAAAVQKDINNLKQQELNLRKQADAIKNSLSAEQLQIPVRRTYAGRSKAFLMVAFVCGFGIGVAGNCASQKNRRAAA